MRDPLAHRRVGMDDKVSALAHAGIPWHQCAKLGCRADRYITHDPLALNIRFS